MRKIGLIAALFACTLPLTATAHQKPKTAAKQPAKSDAPRNTALAVADRFLNAWQNRAGAEGMKLLSPALRKKWSDADLRNYIVGLSNPHHQAYEISNGRRLDARHYVFRVRLYETYTGYEQRGVRPPRTRIVLVRTNTGDWKIDELPFLANARHKPKSAAGSTATPATTTLTAEQVLNKYVAATGGKAAYEKMKSSIAKGRLDVKAQGITGTFAIYLKAPNKFANIMTMQNVGEIKQGFDGKTAWSKDPFTGLRTLEGGELAEVKRQAIFNSQLKWQELYKKMEMVGLKKVDDKDAYVLRLVPKEGEPITQYYDAKTFLLVRMDMVSNTPQGTMPIQTYLSDYRAVDGLKVPFVTRSKIGAVAEMTLTVEEYKNNPEIDDTLFVKPTADSKPEEKKPAPDKP